MYPVQADMARALPGHAGVTAYRSRAHRTFIGDNGAFIIADASGQSIAVNKPGADGNALDPAIACEPATP